MTRKDATQDGNVFRFDDYSRGRSARRGAADKVPEDPAGYDVDCPRCGDSIRLHAAAAGLASEVLCAGCGASVTPSTEAMEVRG